MMLFAKARQELNFNRNTDCGRLAGIFSGFKPGSVTDGPCATKVLVAYPEGATDLDLPIASVAYEVYGDQYRHAHRAFGDQLEAAGYDRHGY